MSLEEIRESRLRKLESLKAEFGEVFPSKIIRNFTLAEVVADFSKLSKKKTSIFLVGRVFGIRSHGGVVFCDFKDGSLDKKTGKKELLQAYLKKDILGEEKFLSFQNNIDTGDFVEFEGSLFKTQKGEKSIKVLSWRIIAKSLRPLPEKWHGLSDVEERFRKRYLDTVMNDEVFSRFALRSKIISETRNFLDKNGFLEVETPVLQPLAGGALAEPFKTRHNALGIDLFLRIAPELYLKRLLIGGFEKVYELGRNFRNEGIDMTHNPEFTMLEFYAAYKDADYLRGFIEEMFRGLAKKVFGKQKVSYENAEIDFSKKFSVVSFNDILKRHALISEPEKANLDDLKLKAKQFGIEIGNSDSWGKIADNIFKKVCRSKIIQPTFVVDIPLELSPLAKKKTDKENEVDRFQLIVGGIELVNGFSELNDPLDQKKRFEKQQEFRKAGDKEAAEFDKSFVEAMEYGMPPAAGAGIGIDRLVMFLTNTKNIREVVLFPTLRPKE
ncbi:MAG: lysine--tRNA ligase [Candidatus Pacebacteria bacterium]|nr:lysine--tRNA ligase [Candidatus Paceibacterota bacterium]